MCGVEGLPGWGVEGEGGRKGDGGGRRWLKVIVEVVDKGGLWKMADC